MQSRRLFVKSGAMAMLSLGFAPPFLTRAAAATGTGRKLLIALFQRGAVDGLNMVVPYGEREYYQLRPTIAIPKPGADRGAADLNGFFGLHPRMSPLLPLWANGSMAIVHACGSPDHTRSHFDAQDYLETGTPGVKSTRDGWINRYLRESNPKSQDPKSQSVDVRAVSLTRQMPRIMQGQAEVLAFAGADEFTLRGDPRTRRAFEEAYASASVAALGDAGRDAFAAMRTLAAALPPDYQPEHGAQYPRSPFGQALREIARLAKADVGLEIAFAESGQWDHHVNEAPQLDTRLDDFARGIAALAMDLGDRLADTVILTMSEFGRAAAENGNRGTDHGHGTAMLAIGGPVKGGIYGRWPGLSSAQRFEGRDLAITTDFRELFSTVATSHLGADAAALQRIFPGYASTGSCRGLIRT